MDKSEIQTDLSYRDTDPQKKTNTYVFKLFYCRFATNLTKTSFKKHKSFCTLQFTCKLFCAKFMFAN